MVCTNQKTWREGQKIISIMNARQLKDKKRPYDIKTNSGKEKVSLWEKNSRTLKRMIFLKEKRGESVITYKP